MTQHFLAAKQFFVTNVTTLNRCSCTWVQRRVARLARKNIYTRLTPCQLLNRVNSCRNRSCMLASWRGTLPAIKDSLDISASFGTYLRIEPDASRKACNWPSARQDAKEHELRDHCGCRLGDSYSPRRHWCFRSPSKSVGPGLRTDV
jgi:hypothetical protein